MVGGTYVFLCEMALVYDVNMCYDHAGFNNFDEKEK